METIGLVAGYGELPILFAKAAKERGDRVVGFGLKGATSTSLEAHVEKMHWLEWGNLQKGIILLATAGVKKIVLLGKIRKDLLFKNDAQLDEKASQMISTLKDKKDYAVLGGVTKMLKLAGITVIDPTPYLSAFLPLKGTLTKGEPTKDEWDDIRYGCEIAGELARRDIGQAVAVKEKTVIALEAVEGTDETIRRAGTLSNGGFTIVKVARPDQDMRFDIPLIGLDTLKALIAAKGRVLALQEKKTLLIDKDEMIRLADEKGVAIVVV